MGELSQCDPPATLGRRSLHFLYSLLADLLVDTRFPMRYLVLPSRGGYMLTNTSVKFYVRELHLIYQITSCSSIFLEFVYLMERASITAARAQHGRWSNYGPESANITSGRGRGPKMPRGCLWESNTWYKGEGPAAPPGRTTSAQRRYGNAARPQGKAGESRTSPKEEEEGR